MKTNKEIRNDELKISMITLKLQNDKESEDIFIENLRKAYFLIPAVDDDKKDELTFMLLCDQNNNNYFQAYTDMDEYSKWSDSKKSKNFVLKFDELASIIVSSEDEVKGLAINPFSENIILDKDFLDKTFKMDKIFIEEEKDCPNKIKNVIKKTLKKYEKIDKAYLMNIQKNSIPGYLLIIDSKIKNKKKLYDEIGNDITNNIDQLNLDIISSTDEIAKDLIENKKAFYIKK